MLNLLGVLMYILQYMLFDKNIEPINEIKKNLLKFILYELK
jgi:hypothetical protein